jgi:hypothetical protein
MDNLIEAIRAAIIEGATEDARKAGASACRAILAALEARPGEPLVPPVPTSTSSAEIIALVSTLRGVPTDQLLDLAIAKLRTLVPTDQTPTVRSIKIPIVPMPRR